MASSTTPPPALKAIQPFLKVAAEYDKRDKIIAYYARLHAVQQGIKINSKTTDCRTFLFSLMDSLEQTKKVLADSGEEAVSNDLVAQAHVEGAALKLFLLADSDDRAGVFTKTVVKRFYTANLLFDTLNQFGEQSEENAHHQKYSKWKATYIHKCMKTGETPEAGPTGAEFEEEFGFDGTSPVPGTSMGDGSVQPQVNNDLPYPLPNAGPGMPSAHLPPGSVPTPFHGGAPPSQHSNPPQQPTQTYNPPPQQPQASPRPAAPAAATSPSGGGKLDYTDFTEATKLCKYAISAMQYEDVSTAVENLTKALAILKSK